MDGYTRIEGIDEGINSRIIVINDAITKTSPRRWIMLILYVLTNALTNFQWIQYSAISDIVCKYYNVSYEAVNWTFLVYSLLYIPMAIPGSYLVDKFGLRNAVLSGTMLTCLGAWVKIFSTNHDMFYLVLIGQLIVASSAMFTISTPAAVAAAWFGPNEKSTACSLGIFGAQIGVAFGFIVPPQLISQENDDAAIARNLFIMLFVIAVILTILFIVQLMFFEDRPLYPPSNSEVQKRSNGTPPTNFFKTLHYFVTHKSFIIHVISNSTVYGLNLAVLTLLNQILSNYYADASLEAGRIGFIMVISGMLGTLVCGFALDKFYQYKVLLIVIQLFCMLGIILFAFVLGYNIFVVYVVSSILGFFWASVQPVGYEAAIELIYPKSEGLAVGFLLTASQLFGIIFTYFYSYFLYNFGSIFTNILVIVIMTIALFLITFIRFEYQRRYVNISLIFNEEDKPLLH
ncbi:hypothetical protein FQR65_LT13688 [Abscondita terminalis]|nr:hypothetical protein FQR65_LT13688 [Abscondita terminalis]